MSRRPYRIGFVGARSARYDDGLWTDAGLGRLIDGLARGAAGITVALSHLPERRPLDDHRTVIAADDFLPLPHLHSVRRDFFRVAECRRVIRQVEERSDVVLVQLPFAAPLALLGGRRPRLYHLCADVWRQVHTSPWYRGPRRVPAVALAWSIDRLQRHLARRPAARLVTNGADLYQRYGQPPGRWVVSSSLFDREIGSVASSRAPDDGALRILFVGYLRHEKGFDVLLDAFEQLVREQPRAELYVVGASSTADRGVGSEIARRLEAPELAKRLHLLGHRGFGEELFQVYADSDVLVVPSRSEGTPRVLVEARAFGCAVIGSRVGGVPSSIDHGVDGLLVPADDPAALLDALRRLDRDPELRAQLVEAGVERARQATMERFTAAMLEQLDALLAPSPQAHAETAGGLP